MSGSTNNLENTQWSTINYVHIKIVIWCINIILLCQLKYWFKIYIYRNQQYKIDFLIKWNLGNNNKIYPIKIFKNLTFYVLNY